MSKFQRRHYEAIAEALAFSDAPERVVDALINVFNQDNSNFDRKRFKGRIAGLKSPVI